MCWEIICVIQLACTGCSLSLHIRIQWCGSIMDAALCEHKKGIHTAQLWFERFIPADQDISGVATTVVGHQGSLQSYQPGWESQHMTMILWQDTVACPQHYTCKQHCVWLTKQSWFCYYTCPLNMLTQVCVYVIISFVSCLQTTSWSIG